MGNPGTKAATSTAVAARTRTWSIAAGISLGWAALTLTILHVLSSFDPLRDPLSRYAFTDRGQGMLEASLLSFAIGVITVRGALGASGLAVGHTTSILTVATAIGLLTAARFPATYTSDIDPASGLVHQYASLIAFLCLPGIAWSLLDQVRDVPELRRCRAVLVRVLQVAVVTLGVFGTCYVADHLPPIPLRTALLAALPVGLVQRVVLGVDLLLLAVLLMVAQQAARTRQKH